VQQQQFRPQYRHLQHGRQLMHVHARPQNATNVLHALLKHAQLTPVSLPVSFRLWQAWMTLSSAVTSSIYEWAEQDEGWISTLP
jgi:hypothetical protein